MYYVGQSVQSLKRQSFHRNALRNQKHTNAYLQNAWNLYGEQAFDFFLLETNLSNEEADHWEIELIKWFKTLNLSYNLDLGGKANKQMSQETKDKIGNANRGKERSEEQKKAISEFHKGNQYQLGLKRSNESKKLMSEKAKARGYDSELLKRMTEINKEREYKPHSEEAKRKMSEAAKRRKKNG